MTLFTSVTKMKKEQKIYFSSYVVASLFFFVFQFIYELFSHGVTSNYMRFAFMIPLVGGSIIMLSFRVKTDKYIHLFRQFMNGGVIWLTLGSLFEGVLEIYGTTNRLVLAFGIVGTFQLGCACLVFLIRGKKEM